MTDTAAVDAMLERIDAASPASRWCYTQRGSACRTPYWRTRVGDSFQQVLWPKMLGAWHLHRTTMHRGFGHVRPVLQLWRACWATQVRQTMQRLTHFLDQLAAHRRAFGLPGQTIAWGSLVGAWRSRGAARAHRKPVGGDGHGLDYAAAGAKSARKRWCGRDAPAGMVASVDWPTFATAHDDLPPFLEELSSADDMDETSESPEDVLSQLRASSQTESESILVSFLQKELQAVMRLSSPPSTLDRLLRSGNGLIDGSRTEKPA